jgi:glycine/D-amino acid oxidase-like deaminating enzyme
MELTSDYPVWSILNGVPATFPSLKRNLNCDVVVIGGGITGALAAFHLVQAGVHTVLLDKRDIGTGSTSASTGLLQYEVDVPLRDLTGRIGERCAFRSYQVCGEAITKLERLIKTLKIQCGYERKPSLFLARAPGEIPQLRKEFQLRKQAGFDLEFWTTSEIAKHFPFSRPAALFSNLGGQVDPHKLTHGLLCAGCRHGLQVFDRCNVIHFEPNHRGIQLRTAEGCVIRARRAVIAAGFESMAYLRGEAGKLKSTFALISEPVESLQGWYRKSLIWESGMPYLYLRTTAENRVIVGGEDVELVDPRKRDALIKGKTQALLRKFRLLFPGIELEVAYSWAGTFGETRDGLAYIGENRGLPHAYFALGYGGNGITYSLIAAEIIRDDFLGRHPTDAKLFQFGRK